MARVIIHIGMHKTGSSSIQAYLYAMRNDLVGFHYLDMRVDNPTGPLLDAFLYTNERLQQLIDRGAQFTINEVLERKKKALARFKDQVKAAQGKDLIISAEGLVYLSLDQLAEMKNILNNDYNDFKVVVYVRTPKAFMQSMFQQRLKGDFKRLNLINLLPGYQERFEKFEIIFGPDVMEYWLFIVAELHQRCVVTDFCTRLNIPVNPLRIVRVNESLSLNAVVLLYLYRLYGPGFGETKRALRENFRLVEKLANLQGEKFYFSDALISGALRKGKKDFDWMEGRMGEGSLTEPDISQDQQISSISDLEKVSYDALNWLADEINFTVSELSTKEQIAKGVQKLREVTEEEFRAQRQRERKTKKRSSRDLSKDSQTKHNKEDRQGDDTTLDLSVVRKIVEKVYEKDHNFSTIPKEVSINIVRDSFTKILTQLDNMDEGACRVDGLGVFKIRMINKKTGDTKGQKIRKIFFIPH